MSGKPRVGMLYFFLSSDEVGAWSPCIDFLSAAWCSDREPVNQAPSTAPAKAPVNKHSAGWPRPRGGGDQGSPGGAARS